MTDTCQPLGYPHVSDMRKIDTSGSEPLSPPADRECVLCGGPTRRLYEIAGYWIRECHACPHQFAEFDGREGHVERIYGDGYFFGGGAGYCDHLSEERLLIDRGRWYARKMARYFTPGTVLDVGASAGFTLQGLSAGGWQGIGIEPNAGMAQCARERFGLPVEAASLETWTTDRSFDLVTMLQVLPHFIDPRQAILKAGELLRPNGHLLIETWNQRSWMARLFGKNWHEYSPPSVLHWFSKRGLIRLADRAGFEPIAQGRPSKWIDAGHAKSLLQFKADSSLGSRIMLEFARILPDRIAIPYLSADLFWMLFRRRGSALKPR